MEKENTVLDDTKNKQPEEVTKRSLRVQTWKAMTDERLVPYSIFNRVPNFAGADKAAELLALTPEFKNAKNIKVNMDRTQEMVKILTLSSEKNLFVAAPRSTSSLLSQIKCPSQSDISVYKKAIRDSSLNEYGTNIDVGTDVKLDMIVVGSVAVSKDGYRIGRGNGYVDLDFSILVHAGLITKDTIIVTTVHDLQVYDTLPAELFKSYDIPIDMIVTYTEVIRCPKKLQRPTGIQWHLLSERRLGIVSVLKTLKANEEKNGKVIVLKSEDTDVESYRKQGSRSNRRRRKPRSTSDNVGDSQDNFAPRPRRQRQRRYGKVKGGGGEGGGKQTNSENSHKTNSNKKRRENQDFCIKISNISRHIRIKDLKAELRKRGCHPMFISWKGAFGKCYLHFNKHNNGEPDNGVNDILKSLDNLSLTVPKGDDKEETVSLRVDLIKRKVENRIETTDVTSV